ncbi:hypothetical protein D3C75_606480 [compost metagenome]
MSSSSVGIVTVGVPTTTGASFTGLTVKVKVRVVISADEVPPGPSSYSTWPGSELGSVRLGNVTGREPELPPSLTATVTPKLPFQSDAVALPGTSGSETFSPAR